MKSLTLLCIVLAIIAIVGWWKTLDYRKRYHIRAEKFPVPFKKVEISELHPLLKEGDTGPTLASETHFIGRGVTDHASVSDTEAWILSVIAKEAKNIFEFGTASGRTAYLMAKNSPTDAKVVTLTLPPDMVSNYETSDGDTSTATAIAKNESRYTRFMYSDTNIENKIQQVYCDSKQFDEAKHARTMDLVFIDGSHAYSYIKSDTEKALAMCRPGAYIIWHDYRGPNSVVSDVYHYLNDLSARIPLEHVKGTSFVCHRCR